jgi:hypothetical protein
MIPVSRRSWREGRTDREVPWTRVLGAGAIAVLLIAFARPGGAWAQDPPGAPPAAEQAPEPTDRWVVERWEAVDLWFHTLAVAGVEGRGLLPLYSRRYAERVRARKDSLGVYPTMLDGAAGRIRRTVDHDDRLAFVHVLPLYFPDASVGDMLAALEAVARQQSGERVLSIPSLRFGTAVVADVFADSRSRDFLGDLVRVMRNEYDAFFREFRASEVVSRDSGAGRQGDAWSDQLARDLADFFARVGLRRGTIVPSPAIGAEGRVVQFDPFGPEGRIVAAGMSLGGVEDGTALNGVLKELCYAVIDRADIVDGDLDRGEREDLRTRAAVRCGAMILQFHAPARLIGYRHQFVTAALPGTAHPSSAAAFESAFPLEPDRLARVKAVIRGR